VSAVATTVGKFVWHEQVSADPKQAQDFYTQLFGWEVDVWKPGEIDYPMISSGGQMHGGFGKAQDGAPPPHWLGHVQVENVDEAAKRAKEGGGKVVFGPMDMPEIGRMAIITDPQGAAVGLYQPETEGPESSGVFVWDELATSDVDAAKRFYGKVFGWEARDVDMGAGSYTILHRPGEEYTAGLMALGDIPAPPHWMYYIAADDVDETATRAKELGGTVIREPFDIEGGRRIAILQDPDGAVFGLFKGAS
jgi:predicted enzyme related to lactoylglutathione lyase